MDWDDEYTLLATSSKGDALDFLNVGAGAPTEAEDATLRAHPALDERATRADDSCSAGTAPLACCSTTYGGRLRSHRFQRSIYLTCVQTDTVQALRGDPSTSEEEHIRIMLVQTEVERVKFIVRSYIRTRALQGAALSKATGQD